jgi:hypothetical protein
MFIEHKPWLFYGLTAAEWASLSDDEKNELVGDTLYVSPQRCGPAGCEVPA